MGSTAAENGTGADSPDATTRWLYNTTGDLLVTEQTHQRVAAQPDTATGSTGVSFAGAADAGALTTSHGYQRQHVTSTRRTDSASTTTTSTDGASGLGSYVSAVPAEPDGTLYTISDRHQLVPPRGNAPGSAPGAYLHTWTVDNASPTAAPNSRPAGTVCVGGGGNTGLVCAQRTPATGGHDAPSAETFTYDPFGHKLSWTRPEQHGTEQSYRYTYQPNTAVALAGGTPAGGWLKAVTDPTPTGAFVAFGHDAAGNVARTWDRNATRDKGDAASFAVGSAGGYSSTLFGIDKPGTDVDEALSAPWRWLRSSSNPLGDTTRLDVDARGYTTAVTTPRGHTTTTTVNAWGQPLTVRTPAHPDNKASYDYDGFGNAVLTRDFTGTETVLGTPTATEFDAVNRPIRRSFVRGPWSAGSETGSCQRGSGAFSTDLLVCTTEVHYDRRDQPVRTVDADLASAYAVFDSLGRATGRVIARETNTPSVYAEVVYDMTVPVRRCSPRQYDPTEPGATRSCPAGPVSSDPAPDAAHVPAYGTAVGYDTADRPVVAHTRRDARTVVTVQAAYDRNGNLVGTTDGEGTPTTSEFDVLDRMVKLTRLRSVQPRVELVTAWHYDRVGNTLAVASPGAPGDNTGAVVDGQLAGTDVRITGYTYDAANRPIDTITALQVAHHDPRTAGAQAELDSALDRAVPDEAAQTNLRSRVAYDADGNITATWDQRAFVGRSLDAPDDRFVLRTGYDANGRPDLQQAARYDSAGSGPLTDLTGPNAQQNDECPHGATGFPAGVGVCTTRLGYDPNGNIKLVELPGHGVDSGTGSRVRRLTYSYTADNLVKTVTAPDPAANGSQVTVADYSYDGTGRTVRSTNAAGHTTVTGYYGDGLPRTLTPPAGPGGLAPRTDLAFDAAGQLRQQRTQRRTYDPTTAAPGATQTLLTEATYTADGLLASHTIGRALADGSVIGSAETTGYGYDKNGNPTSVRAPNAQPGGEPDANPADVPVVNAFTADNLLASTVQPVLVGTGGATVSRTTAYGYDPAGRKSSVDVDTTGQPGDPHTFGYYPSDRLKTTGGRGGAGSIQRGYDAAGQLLRVDQDVDDPASSQEQDRLVTQVRSSFYLDGLLRHTDLTSTGGPDAGSTRTAFGYDGLGALIARGDGPATGPLSLSRFTSNDAGLPVSMTDPAFGADTPATWRYNSLGQPVLEQLPTGQSQTFQYNTDDTLARTTINSNSALASQVLDDSDPAPDGDDARPDLASYAYRYDELGRVLTQAHFGKGAGGTSVGTASAPVTFGYTYNTAGRLASVHDARGLRDIEYDRNGNRTAYGTGDQVDPTSFTYRADDSIATSTTTNNGQLPTPVTRIHDYDAYGGLRTDGCTTYGYDGFDRLTSTDPQQSPPALAEGCPPGSSDYTYDGLDRQLRSTTSVPGGLPGTSSTLTSRYRYDGLSGNIWQRTDTTDTGTSGGSTTTIDHALTAHGRTLASTTDGAPHFLATDGQGNTALITTSDRTVTCATRYDPYGNPAPNTKTTPASTPCASGDPGHVDIFYRGARRDTGTGNYQLGARTYNPTRAGFLTPDTYRDDQPHANLGLGTDPLTRNTYTYVNGDPLNYTDPTGHEPRPYSPNAGACASGCGQYDWYEEGGSGASDRKSAAREQRRDGAAAARASTPQRNFNCGGMAGCYLMNPPGGVWTPSPPAGYEDDLGNAIVDLTVGDAADCSQGSAIGCVSAGIGLIPVVGAGIKILVKGGGTIIKAVLKARRGKNRTGSVDVNNGPSGNGPSRSPDDSRANFAEGQPSGDPPGGAAEGRPAGDPPGGAARADAGGAAEAGQVKYGELDDLGRPSGVTARLTPEMVGTGSPPLRKIRPPGFSGGGAGHARGHLLGNQLGGSGTDPRNLVTMFQNRANSPVMRDFENEVRGALDSGQLVDYAVTPIYRGADLMPMAVTLQAQGSGGFNLFVTVLNRGL